jgi:hypothetical protein
MTTIIPISSVAVAIEIGPVVPFIIREDLEVQKYCALQKYH